MMHFAAHMTTTNLTSQNIRVKVEPNVYSRDGVEALSKPIDKSVDPPSVEQPLDKWLETMSGTGIPSDFDVVIMNPPFTRRERIPDEVENLEKLVPEVRGKTGYWAYFVVPANKVLRKDGTLAVVMPEEFFVGRSAKSVREYLHKNGFTIQHLVRSATEVAFSEAAHYRDYLIVCRKGKREKQLVVTILKKKLLEISKQVEDISLQIQRFASSSDTLLNTAEFEALKVSNAEDFVSKHIDNLKPLVGFNTTEAYAFTLRLLERLSSKPTLRELEKNELIKIRVYNPGQHKAKGAEELCRKLFASKYGARSPSVTLLFDKVSGNNIHLKLRRAKLSVKLPLDATVPSLRTYSQVRHLDITGEEEFAIINPDVLSVETLRLAGLLPSNFLAKAADDIKSAHEDLAGNFLMVRKARLSSPELYWLTFYSSNNVLGTTSALLNLQVPDKQQGKILSVYLNSTIAFLQLIAFMAETEGAWVTLHGDQVWSNIHVPEIDNLDGEIVQEALRLFSNISKSHVKPLSQRIRTHDKVQRAIDEVALRMVGLDDWTSRLDELYDTVSKELDMLQSIMKKPRKRT